MSENQETQREEEASDQDFSSRAKANPEDTEDTQAKAEEQPRQTNGKDAFTFTED